VAEAARVLLRAQIQAQRPGISAMLRGDPPPKVKAYFDLDLLIDDWLTALAQEARHD
jgi:hypothetical protein